MDQHLRYLDECAELHDIRGKNAGRAGVPSDPLERLYLLNPDMMLEIAKVRVLEGSKRAAEISISVRRLVVLGEYVCAY